MLRTVLSTLLTNLFLVVGSVVCGSAAIVLGLLFPRGSASYQCARLWSRGLLWCAGVALQVESEHQLEGERRYLFMANHQSLFDIPVLLYTLPVSTRFLAKESLFRIPVFGQALRVTGFVPVDRTDRSRAREAFAGALKQLEAGRSILVFPEETRSPDGDILAFRPGGFLIALRGGCDVVPVGISGTRSIQRKGSLIVRPGRVRVRYGTPRDASAVGVRRKREFIRDVRTDVVRLSGERARERERGEPNAAKLGGS